MQKAAEYQTEVQESTQAGRSLPNLGLTTVIEPELREVIKTLKDRSIKLQAQTITLDSKEMAELKELEARVTLRDNLSSVSNEIERKKRLAAYAQILEDFGTQAITRKSTDLTKRLLTDHLRDVFQEELKKLKFTHLAVEMQSAGGAKGILFHRLVFTAVPGVTVTDVLSEGESRTLSLAAFLTELSTATNKSAIIFDDPVSSLDHIWRERIAQRLAEEATNRQVIVFTHDLLFLRFLTDEANRQEVQCDHQYIRRQGDQVGRLSPDLPWMAMNVKQRVGVLRNRLQQAEKLFKTSSDNYEREESEIFALLREAWEYAVSEVLLK